MSAVDGLLIILSGAAPVDDDALVSDDVPDDGVADEEDDDVDGDDVPGLVDELDDDDGGVLGLIEELDEVEPVEGVVDGVVVVVDEDDVDGEGVTTGGVVADVFVSRWQPATPSARPVHSSVTKVALLIVISRSG
jgi:hypothetical protein